MNLTQFSNVNNDINIDNYDVYLCCELSILRRSPWWQIVDLVLSLTDVSIEINTATWSTCYDSCISL